MKASFITTHPNASNEPIAQTSIEKVTGRTSRQVQDQLAIEEPIEIQITYGPSHSRGTRRNRFPSQCVIPAMTSNWLPAFC